MAQTVTTKFSNAQNADANFPVGQVQLVLGNYFSSAAYGTTVVSSGDGSTDYPASGAIDGDRTEINEGAASSADNGIGHSTWQSATVPTVGSPVTLTITLTSARTINRVKVYCPEFPGSSGPHSYSLSYWNGAAFVVFAATSDIVAGGQTSITSTLKLDTVDFPDVTASIFKLTVYDAQTQKCHLVEIEAYRLVDITDRVKSVRPARHRDYKLANPMAATISIGCINVDRFFSINHVPTSAEVTAGFINTELQPGVGIIAKMGFNYFGAANELVTVFTGEIDSITVDPASREASIQGRDLMKRFINKIDSTKLKISQDIGSNIQYVLNRANVSDFEMSIDQTGINLDYFFTENQSVLDTIRDLAQAAGDTFFFIDEFGVATFRDYTGSITNQHLYTSEIDWEAGTLANISTIGAYVDQLAVPQQFIPALSSGSLGGGLQNIGGNLSFPQTSTYSGASFNLGGGSYIALYNPSNGLIQRIAGRGYAVPRSGTINTVTIGPWDGPGNSVITIWADSGGLPNFPAILYQESSYRSDPVAPVTITINQHIAAQTIWIGVQTGGAILRHFQMATVGSHSAEGVYTFNSNTPFALTFGDGVTPANIITGFTFTYDVVSNSGTWTSPWDDSASIALNLSPVVNNTGSYPSGCSGNTYLDASDDGSTVAVTYSTANLNGSHTFAVAQHRYWRLRIDAATSDNIRVPVIGPPYLLFGATGTWTSPILDTGGSTISLSAVTDTHILNGGTITYYTNVSSDGITWDGYVATSPSGLILSATKRYVQTQVVISLGPGGVTPLILDITVSWVSGAGSPKYPAVASFTFSFDSSLMAAQQELADNLGGDTSILNDIVIQAQPLVLAGTNSDTVWQGTIGTPPSNISGSTPLAVVSGTTYVFSPVVAGGIDISRMSGANPAAGVVVFSAGAAGSWKFSSIHPTLPVLAVTVTNSGNITDLRIIGETFQNASYLQAAIAQDATSIAKYGDRRLSISNAFITSTTIASAIANALLANFKNPTSYIPMAKVQFCPAAQLGDRVTIIDTNLDLSADYIVVGEDHVIETTLDSSTVETAMVLLKVPMGS